MVSVLTMKCQCSVWIALALFSVVLGARKFPNYLPRCHTRDTKLDHCLAGAIEKSFKIISTKGIPSIRLPSIEPLEVIEMKIEEDSDVKNLVQKYHDLKIHGFSTQRVKKAHLDLDNKTLTFTAYMDEMVHKSKYELNGTVLLVPIEGKGNCTIEYKQPTIHHNLTFMEKIKHGDKYFKLTSYNIKIEPKFVHLQYDNLFDGNENLGEFLNKFLNNNWEIFYNSFKPRMEHAYATVFRKVAERMFDVVPVDAIFLH